MDDDELKALRIECADLTRRVHLVDLTGDELRALLALLHKADARRLGLT
jgi:hypothetical protein